MNHGWYWVINRLSLPVKTCPILSEKEKQESREMKELFVYLHSNRRAAAREATHQTSKTLAEFAIWTTILASETKLINCCKVARFQGKTFLNLATPFGDRIKVVKYSLSSYCVA